jgi:hypothetical protein
MAKSESREENDEINIFLYVEYASSTLKMEASSSSGKSVNIVTCMCDYRRGFGMDMGFIVHFNTLLVIPRN